MNCCNCGKDIKDELYELTKSGCYCETCWDNFSKDERYYRRHKSKVQLKNKTYHGKTKHIFNPIRNQYSKSYWIDHKEEILAKRKSRRQNDW